MEIYPFVWGGRWSGVVALNLDKGATTEALLGLTGGTSSPTIPLVVSPHTLLGGVALEKARA